MSPRDPGAHRDLWRRVIGFVTSLALPGSGHFVFARWGMGVAWFVVGLTAILAIPLAPAVGLGVFVATHPLAALHAALVRRGRILYPSWGRVLLGWLALAAATLGFGVGVRVLYLDEAVVASAAMRPGLARGDRVVFSRSIYRGTAPVAGDVVAVARPEGVAFARVIAGSGDRVALRGGVVQVNGIPATVSPRPQEVTLDGERLLVASETLHDERHRVRADAPSEEVAEALVPDGHVFVLCDDRPGRADSRTWGPVRRADVLGKALLVWWSDGPAGPRWARVAKRVE